MNVIQIVPVEGGWMVRSGAIGNPLFFRGGAAAESAARRLAQGFADAGGNAQIEIFIRDGSLARHLTAPALRESTTRRFESV
jgi:hypothetical protein